MQTAQQNSARTEHLLQMLVSMRGVNPSVGRFQSASIKRIHHMNKKVQASQNSYEELRARLEGRAMRRRHGPAQPLLTNADFRTAAKALFDLTEVVPEPYWSYGIKFE